MLPVKLFPFFGSGSRKSNYRITIAHLPGLQQGKHEHGCTDQKPQTGQGQQSDRLEAMNAADAGGGLSMSC